MSNPMGGIGKTDKTTDKTIHKAYDIAVRDIRSNYEWRNTQMGRLQVLCAGKKNFREPWSRELGFAYGASLLLNDSLVIKQTLDLFLHHQRKDGMIPIKMLSQSPTARIFKATLRIPINTRRRLGPRFKSGLGAEPLDHIALFINACAGYILFQQDKDMARRYLPKLQKAMKWLQAHDKDNDGIIEQRSYADWKDMIKRKGKVFYTNLCYWRALKRLSQIARLSDLSNSGPSGLLSRKLENQAEAVHQKLNHYFWHPDKGYYINSNEFDNLSTEANVLAIAWDFADKHQAEKIQENIFSSGVSGKIPSQTVFPKYPFRVSSTALWVSRNQGYHNGFCWPWIGAIDAIAKEKTGLKNDARKALKMIAELIVRDNTTHEVYEPNGRPLKRFFYRSESPFTWTAGMYIVAYNYLKSKQSDKEKFARLYL